MQSTIAGGLVLLTVVADRLFGIAVRRREWIGVGLMALGLAALAITVDGDARTAHSQYAPGALAAYLVVVAAAGLVLAAVSRRGTVLAISAGLLWAASDTSIKALSSHLDALGAAVLVQSLAVVILAASLIGLLVSARSLQLGEAVTVIALTSVAANLTTIAAGPLVFGEPMPNGQLSLTVRLLAFVLVVASAALTPAPMSATGVDPHDRAHPFRVRPHVHLDHRIRPRRLGRRKAGARRRA